ncbi:MAG: response regulator transcription factor, partial [Pseudomonadota bacterium]
LLTALESVLNDETYISQTFASRVINALRDANLRRAAAEAVRLSIRENQIVRLLLRGKTNREIATSLKISERTVKHYMTALMQKLQVRNRTEVALAAQKLHPDGAAAVAH